MYALVSNMFVKSFSGEKSSSDESEDSQLQHTPQQRRDSLSSSKVASSTQLFGSYLVSFDFLYCPLISPFNDFFDFINYSIHSL